VKAAYQTTTSRRALSRREIAADGLVHLIGIVAGIGGGAALLAITLTHGDPFEFAVISIYAAALVAMFGCSAAYNLVRCERLREVFYRFDHAAIFALIAATYTPFTVLRLEGAWGNGLTMLLWTVAGIGIALKLSFPRRFEPFFVVLYLAMGWIGVVAFEPLIASLGPATLILLAAGGIFYTTGVIFHLWERLPFHRAVWHGFVVVAAGVHYAAVLNEVIRLHATA
jgi:hemolysin III